LSLHVYFVLHLFYLVHLIVYYLTRDCSFMALPAPQARFFI
jgi:hypothetical protein